MLVCQPFYAQPGRPVDLFDRGKIETGNAKLKYRQVPPSTFQCEISFLVKMVFPALLKDISIQTFKVLIDVKVGKTIAESRLQRAVQLATPLGGKIRIAY